VPGRRLDAEPAVAEIHLVEVRLEDFILRVVTLHFTGRGLFAQLPHGAPIGPVDDARVHVAHKLLRDRARTADVPADGVLDGAGYADEVHAIVLVEALVFDGDERLRHVLRQRSQRDVDAILDTDFANE
jgi:hypothetical protein